MQLTIQSQDDDVVRMEISGGITQKQVNPSKDPMRENIGDDVYSRKVLVSLQNNDFIDSSGISWLLICHKRFLENGGRMVIHSIPSLVDNVLRILRMESVFELARDEGEAMQKINQPRPAQDKPDDAG